MQVIGKILRNEKVAADIYKMIIECPELAAQCQPGQFVNVRVSDTDAPLLRRPISLHGIDREHGTVTLLYLIVGDGTRRLSAMVREQPIDLIGPLGHGFTLDFAGSKALLVAGGIGVAPLAPLVEALRANGKEVKLLQGARTEKALVALNCDRAVATDDGSVGEHGFVTELLESELQKGGWDYIYICGPKPMLRAAEQVALNYHVAGEVSAEERMGCGLGVCLSCSTKAKSGKNLRVCVDGPVFGIGVLSYE